MDCQNVVHYQPLARRISPDEMANSVTHGVGFILSIIAAAVLIRACEHRGEAWLTAACCVYSLSLIGVYAASTISHVVQNPPWRRFFRSVDQGFIYLLIVGSFTPFALRYLVDEWWSVLVWAMWGVAIAGCLSKVLRAHRVDAVSTVTYLLLGWMPITAIKPMIEFVPTAGLWWVLTGGLCYTIGTWFLMHDHRAPYYHAVWHLLVIAGTACHYFVILCYVVPGVA